MDTRFDRQERLFGKEGQHRIRDASVAIIGLGGLGTHTAQQLALLGVRKFALVEGEELDNTNRNRYIGVDFIDPVPGSSKVNLAERLIKRIDPTAEVQKVPRSLISREGFDAVRSTAFTFCCVDSDGVRFVTNEVCSAYERPYIDLATDVIPGEPLKYGGRVFVNLDGHGCLFCMDVIDGAEATLDLMTRAQRKDRDAIYGVNRKELGSAGPSVVSLNGVIASIGVTEFMVSVTGLRPPQRLTNYYAESGRFTLSLDAPPENCYYCRALRGKGDSADVERYVRVAEAEAAQKTNDAQAVDTNTPPKLQRLNS